MYFRLFIMGDWVKKLVVNTVLRQPAKNGILPVWDENSKVLMLGSITATDGIRKGFYYASERNQLWQLLDCVLETDCFIGLKRQLKQNYDNYVCGKIDESVFEENRAKTRQMFAYELKKRKIAICDIFLECYFNNNSSLDNDIILNNPQYPAVSNAETIRNIIQNSKIRYVVVNSRFVQKQFEKMKICRNFEVVYVVSPSPRKGSIESKLASWRMVFDKVMDRNTI